MTTEILIGDCRAVLATMASESVDCVVTSPPYWGLRSYLPDDDPDKHLEIGSEPTVEDWVETMVAVFREVHRVLRPKGTLWLNLGDSYAGGRSGPDTGSMLEGSRRNQNEAKRAKQAMTASRRRDDEQIPRSDLRIAGLKAKDMVGQPWRVAFALQADGWWLRQEIIWRKPNPMPESARDRFTKAHEHVFLLSKSERYYFNFDAVQEKASGTAHARKANPEAQRIKRPGFGHGYDETAKPRYLTPAGWAVGSVSHTAAVHQTAENHRKVAAAERNTGRQPGWREGLGPKAELGAEVGHAEGKAARLSEVTAGEVVDTRNPRSVQDIDEDEFQQFLDWKASQAIAPDVWDIPTHPFKGAHFATFPPALARQCILAGCPPGGTVLDPFFGSGTVGLEADRLQMHAVLIDLDKRNAPMARDRVEGDGALFAEVRE